MAGSAMEFQVNRSVLRAVETIQLKGGNKPEESLNRETKSFTSCGSGFTYKKTSRITRNRAITWILADNTLLLQESSLDNNLFSNVLEITCLEESLLPNIVIHETDADVVIYVATSFSVHQLVFTHPNKDKNNAFLPSGLDVSLPSIFYNATNKASHSIIFDQECHTFDISLPYVALATVADSVLVTECPKEDMSDDASIAELKQTSVMAQLWSGLGSFFSGDASSGQHTESLAVHAFGTETFVFCLCRDLKIRVWNAEARSCVLVKDLTTLIPDDLTAQQGIVQSLLLRKTSGELGQVILAVHVNLTYQSQFIILEAFAEKTSITVQHVSSFFSNMNCLQDMAVTTQLIWALWTTASGDSSLYYAPIEGGKDFERGWHSVHIQPESGSDVYVPMHKDAKEVYVNTIFAPFCFSKESIVKAVKVFIKATGTENDLIPDAKDNLSTTKEMVVQLLDQQVQQHVFEHEIDASEYQELQLQYWSHFYSFILQCHLAAKTPVGLLADSDSGRVNVIRREGCGYVLDNAWIDHLYLTDLSTTEGLESYVDNALSLGDKLLSHDFIALLECLKMIPLQFSSDVLTGLPFDMDGNEDVKMFLENMATVLVSNYSEFEQLIGEPIERSDALRQMEIKLTPIRQPMKVIESIIHALDVVEFTKDILANTMEVVSEDNTLEMLLSNDGINIIAKVVVQLCELRINICRDLFILIKLIETIQSKCYQLAVPLTDMTAALSTCYELLRAYHSIHWIGTHSLEEVDDGAMDKNLTNLAALDITERSPASKSARKKELDPEKGHTSILHSFIRDVGLKNALACVTETNLNRLKPGNYSVSEVIQIVTSSVLTQVWPLNDKVTLLPEYLVTQCQYTTLLEYLHLFDDWCSTGRGAKDFLLAQGYLGSSQPEKALKFFISAARGIGAGERLLLNLIQDPSLDKNGMLVQYFIKVMRLFEQFEYSDMIISAATSALTIAQKSDPNRPMLWSVVFKHHLEMGHHKEAYTAITCNPDRTRRHDCLRHFIVTLCEKGNFTEICQYPYVGLEDEVVGIIETRARTMDMNVNKYYNLLYSYHVHKNDYRQAANVMYEQSVRLASEMYGLKSLQQQAKCLLASLTALAVVDKKYAWIVRPRENKQDPMSLLETEPVNQSPKRKEDGEEVYHHAKTTAPKKPLKRVIVELSDLEKEYLLVLARLKLIQHGKNDMTVIGPGLSATELIGLLSVTGLFDTAFSLASKFDVSMESVFESLANKCAQLASCKTKDLLNSDCWKWLTLNEILSTQPVVAKSATNQAFNLLQSYLEKFSPKKSSIYMKPVARTLLSWGLALPSWFIKLYKEADPAELLRVYIVHDMIGEATQLAVGYIDAVMGTGTEYYGLNTTLHATTPAVWLPYTAIDALLIILRKNLSNPDFAELCEELQDKLEEYFAKVEVTTNDKLQLAYDRTIPVA